MLPEGEEEQDEEELTEWGDDSKGERDEREINRSKNVQWNYICVS